MLIRLVALLALSMSCVAQNAGTSNFRNALQETRLPLTLREGKFGGTGGDLLTREINAARTAKYWRRNPSICSLIASKPGGLHPLSLN